MPADIDVFPPLLLPSVWHSSKNTTKDMWQKGQQQQQQTLLMKLQRNADKERRKSGAKRGRGNWACIGAAELHT